MIGRICRQKLTAGALAGAAAGLAAGVADVDFAAAAFAGADFVGGCDFGAGFFAAGVLVGASAAQAVHTASESRQAAVKHSRESFITGI